MCNKHAHNALDIESRADMTRTRHANITTQTHLDHFGAIGASDDTQAHTHTAVR